VKNVNFILCNFSNILATRQQGEAARELLRERIEEGGHLILNFGGVDAVAPPFLDELLEEVYATLRRHRDAGILVTVVGANEDDRDTIRMVVEMERWPGLAYLNGETVDFLSESPQLAETLQAAWRLGGTFTAPQLAQVLDLKLPAMNHRLTQLAAAGAVARRRDETAERGIRYEYISLSDRAVDELRAHVGQLTVE
jgi:DNA-binding MarR family transcriptional regulator